MLLAASLALLLVACNSARPPVTISRASGTPTPAQSATASATPLPPLPPLPLPDPSLPPMASIKAFIAKFGDPPEATLGRFRIPRLDVDAAISKRVVGRDLRLDSLNPFGPTDVTWYDFSVDPRFGGVPGAGRNAVFSAHVDYSYLVHYAGAVYSGPAIFQNLDRLTPGDVIEVAMSGAPVRFAVVWQKQVHETSREWDAIVSASVPEGDAITLITCTGSFDAASQEYDSRIVVRAKRV